MLNLFRRCWPATLWLLMAGRLLPRVPAGQQLALLPSYFVKFQYSGKMANSALYLTFCNLFWTAMIS
jgi:hypothetical protein